MAEASKNGLSQADRAILAVLQQHGRISNVELAQLSHTSESNCLRRTRALERSGVIAGYRAVVEPRRLGLGISAYVQVNVDQRSETDTRAFFEALAQEPRVIECVAVTGPFDLLLKVVARNMDDLAELTMEGILSFPSVKDIASCVVMKEIKPPSPLPLGLSPGRAVSGMI